MPEEQLGVTEPEASPVPEGVIDAPPAPEEAKPDDDVSRETPPKEEEDQETLPFGKHPRWIERNKQLQEAKEAVKAYEKFGDVKAIEEAIHLKKLMDEKPETIHKWLEGRLKKVETSAPTTNGQATSETDKVEAGLETMLSGFEPEAAEPIGEAFKFLLNKVRQYDQLIEKGNKDRADWEAMTKEDQERSMENRQAEIDVLFDTLAHKQGWCDENGNGDEAFLGPLAKNVLVELQYIAKNPELPTVEEAKKSFYNVVAWMGLVEKKGLGRKVVVTPPASGSKTGGLPGKQPQTREDRVKDILSIMG